MIQPGDTVKVFDAKVWGGRDGPNGNAHCFKEATVLSTHLTEDKYRDHVATVRFHHDGRISKGRFTDGMEKV